jgi:hypothetical protein
MIYQATTRNRCSKLPPPRLDMSMCELARMDTFNYEMSHTFKGPGQWRMVRQYKICFFKVSLNFQIDLNTLGVLTAPGDKKK